MNASKPPCLFKATDLSPDSSDPEKIMGACMSLPVLRDVSDHGVAGPARLFAKVNLE